MNQTYKATLSQHALPQFLPTWGDLEVCSLETMMFEKYPSISPYTYCANNPMKFVDPTGEELINSYQEGWDKAKQKLAEAKQAFDAFGGNRKADGYKETKKNFNQAKKEFRKIDRPYQLVKEAMSDLAKYNPGLYVQLDELEDENENPVNVYVEMANLSGLYGQSIVAVDNLVNRKFQSKYGENSVVIQLNHVLFGDDGQTLAHEGGHTVYDVKKFLKSLQYSQTYTGGHGPSGQDTLNPYNNTNDEHPSGRNAWNNEIIYLNNVRRAKNER